MWYRWRWSLLIVTGVCALLLSDGVRAQSRLDQDGVRLTLIEALSTALEGNLALVSARVDPEIAAEQIVVQESVLDGTFSAGITYIDAVQETTITNNVTGESTAGNNDFDRLSPRVGWTDPLNFGASYTVEFGPTRETGSNRGIRNGFAQDFQNDEDRYDLTLRYDMPLLRGFGKEVKTAPILLARTDAEISLDTLRGNAITVIETVEGAYWDVVASREALRTALLVLERAENLLELNKKKVEVGTLAPIEITQAEAGVASRQEDVIVAEVTMLNAEDELRRLLGLPADDLLWSEAILATDRPSFEKQEIDLEEAIAVALSQRPEVINARRVMSKNELSERVARKNTRSQLDLNAQYAPSTSENIEANVFLDPLLPNNFTTTESDGTSWQIGLNLSVPVGNRQARSNQRIAALNVKKAQLDLDDAEQTVRVQVRTAVRNVDSGHKRVLAARKNVELQREKLAAEEKKFDNGMSTSFEVLQFQTDLADAELALIRAGLDYAKSLTAVEGAKGTLLEARGLEIR